MARRRPLFACMECGRGFATVRAAERASSIGCPKCGGGDIDLYVPPEAPKPSAPVLAALANLKRTRTPEDKAQIAADQDAERILNDFGTGGAEFPFDLPE